MRNLSARTPIIALPYSEKHKAVPKELLMDYETGNIYVVSANDKSVIFDITERIYKQLENMSGNNIEIEIEGIGTIKLTELLEQMRADISSSVTLVDDGEETKYVSKENGVDNKSLNIVNRFIQIYGFNSASPNTVPRKNEFGGIDWIRIPELPDGTLPPTGGGSGENPEDGNSYKVYIIEPVNDKLYLRPSKRQKTSRLSLNCRVVLPRVIDEYSEIEWYLNTSSFKPLLLFEEHVVWSTPTMTQPKANGHHVYKFKTWNGGINWLAELVTYNKQYLPSEVTPEYLEEFYYNKEQARETFVNKQHMQEAYYDKDEVDTKYYDRVASDERFAIKGEDIPSLENYYTKPEVDTRFIDAETNVAQNHYTKDQSDLRFAIKGEGGEGGDVVLTNYYTKAESDSKYPTKTEISDDYYSKEELEEVVNWHEQVGRNNNVMPEFDTNLLPAHLKQNKK